MQRDEKMDKLTCCRMKKPRRIFFSSPCTTRICRNYAHKPSESEKTSEMMTKSSRQGDDGLGCGATADTRGDDDGERDDPNFTSADVPLAMVSDAFN